MVDFQQGVHGMEKPGIIEVAIPDMPNLSENKNENENLILNSVLFLIMIECSLFMISMMQFILATGSCYSQYLYGLKFMLCYIFCAKKYVAIENS